MENYEIIEYLRAETYHQVCKVLRKSDNKVLICKEIYFGNLTEKEKKQLVNEVSVLKDLRHPNILRYYDRIFDKQSQKIFLITEYCEGGDFSKLLKRLKRDREYLPEEKIWKYFMQFILALHEVHRNKLLHRNIQPTNILLDAYDNLKLGDFGFMKINKETDAKYSEKENNYYMAPELFEGISYSSKSEVWACGCFLYELCALTPPFVTMNNISLALKIKNGKFDRIPSRYSDELQRVIQWILTRSLQERPSVDDILNIPQISMQLREKRLRDSKTALQKKEEGLKKKIEDLEDLEKSLKNRETELKMKENSLFEQERKLKEVKERPKTLSINTRGSFNNEEMFRAQISPKYAGISKTMGAYLKTDPGLERMNTFEAKYTLYGDDYEGNTPIYKARSKDFDMEGSKGEGYFNKEIKQILKNLDSIVSSTNLVGSSKHFKDFEGSKYSDKENYNTFNK